MLSWTTWSRKDVDCEIDCEGIEQRIFPIQCRGHDGRCRDQRTQANLRRRHAW